jgi:hypothetical protein
MAPVDNLIPRRTGDTIVFASTKRKTTNRGEPETAVAAVGPKRSGCEPLHRVPEV